MSCLCRSKEGEGQTAAGVQDASPAELLPEQGDSLEARGETTDAGRAEVAGASPPKRHRGRRGGRGRTGSAEGEAPPAKADGEGG